MKWGPIVARRLQLLLDGFNCQSTPLGWFMVGDKTTRQQQDNNLVELEASLAPAEAEVGAMAKADQYSTNIDSPSLPKSTLPSECILNISVS